MAIFEMLGLKNPGVTVVNKIAAKAATKEARNPVLPKGRASAPKPPKKSAAKPKMSKPIQGGGYKTGGSVKKGK